jgi:hypothetical protein
MAGKCSKPRDGSQVANAPPPVLFDFGRRERPFPPFPAPGGAMERREAPGVCEAPSRACEAPGSRAKRMGLRGPPARRARPNPAGLRGLPAGRCASRRSTSRSFPPSERVGGTAPEAARPYLRPALPARSPIRRVMTTPNEQEGDVGIKAQDVMAVNCGPRPARLRYIWLNIAGGWSTHRSCLAPTRL